MLIHYLKIAFRNMWKYKTQNIISIIGLAVGFVCFAFSALWIRYEMNYDRFHPKADRIYRVNVAPFKWDTMGGSASEVQRNSPFTLSDWIKTHYPEIEEACAVQIRGYDEKISFLYYDQNFCKVFDVNLPENFQIAGQTDKPVAVTTDLYNEETIKKIKDDFNYDVQMALPHWPANTNISYSIAVPLPVRNYPPSFLSGWGISMFDIYIVVKAGVDVGALKEKLDKVVIADWKSSPISLILTPLKQLRYKDPTGQIQSDVRFNHIQIFSIAGLLVILCSLFNHLTLHVTRVRMRLRELTLRKVTGATHWQNATTLYFDFMLVVLLSLVVGLMLMGWLLPDFKEYATIGNTNVNIYIELLFYAALLIVCGFVACGIPLLYFRKQVLNESIKGLGYPESRNLFRKASLVLQLVFGLGMMFCSIVFIKQIRFLHHTGLGISRHNIATFEPSWRPLPQGFPLQYIDRVKQLPGIIDAIPVRGNSFLRNMAVTSIIYANTLGPNRTIDIEKDGQKTNYTYFLLQADPRFFDFFGIDIIEGTRHSNETNNKLVINETMLNDLGRDAVATQLDVIGVARDFQLSPTTKTRPTAILYPNESEFTTIAYKYEDGFRQQVEQATEQFLRDESPDHGGREIYRHYMDDIFEEHFASEQALLKLLTVMTIVCILIAIFGVYSLTNLSCEQRRKEIAIRKINGAEVVNIMNIFFKEYLILLLIAALVAFPTGFLIMKRWMEGYVKQTSMDAWLYVLIFLVVFIVIVFTIVSMVWKAANRNPSDVVK